MWLLFAAAAAETERIKMGPSVTHVIFRDPTLIVQQLATLDELSGGRADLVVSFGNTSLLGQYNQPWEGTKPLSRVKEAHGGDAQPFDEGAVTHEGEFFGYSGLWTLARQCRSGCRSSWVPWGGPGRSRWRARIRRPAPRPRLLAENYEYVMET